MLLDKTAIFGLFHKTVFSQTAENAPRIDFRLFVVDYTFLTFTLEIDFCLYVEKNLRLFCSIFILTGYTIF